MKNKCIKCGEIDCEYGEDCTYGDYTEAEVNRMKQQTEDAHRERVEQYIAKKRKLI